MATLTAAQRTTLAQHIRANTNQTIVDALPTRRDDVITDFYNADASPAFVVWKPSVTEQDMYGAYVWTEMDSLVQAKYNQLSLIIRPGVLNTSLAAIRQGLSDIFSAAGLANTRAAILALIKRNCSVMERIFATGTGTTATPGNLVVAGPLSVLDVSTALNENP